MGQKVAKESDTICLMQMITLDDLRDPEELSDIKNDIEAECSNYGTVKEIIVPGLSPTGNPLPGAKKFLFNFRPRRKQQNANQLYKVVVLQKKLSLFLITTLNDLSIEISFKKMPP